MRVEDFNYILPEELIAQKPTSKRDESKLMIVNRKNRTIEHKNFFDIVNYLKEGDTLVLNDSKVLPARLFGIKEETKARVEFLLIKRIEGDLWETLVKPGKKVKIGNRFDFGDDFYCIVEDLGEDGTRHIRFYYKGIFMENLEKVGSMPLPPYIHRESIEEDKDRYQTVYCKEEGSVAAPTAGLHFTKELLKSIENRGINICYVTLHVGIGTFRPVKVENIEEHSMHFEEYYIPQETANIINNTKKAGNKVISVGTTACRTLESGTLNELGELVAGRGSTGIFIYPGYKFKIVDNLITNFHLPKSTLLMLVSALYNREDILYAYEEAKRFNYRFFSYGDAMYIE